MLFADYKWPLHLCSGWFLFFLEITFGFVHLLDHIWWIIMFWENLNFIGRLYVWADEVILKLIIIGKLFYYLLQLQVLQVSKIIGIFACFFVQYLIGKSHAPSGFRIHNLTLHFDEMREWMFACLRFLSLSINCVLPPTEVLCTLVKKSFHGHN